MNNNLQQIKNRTLFLSVGYVAVFIIIIFTIDYARASVTCGNPFVNGYGPYDYTNPNHYQEKLPIVEKHHLQNDVIDNALLIGPKTEKPLYVVGNLDYTLRAFPNHHKALMAMGNYLSYLKKEEPDEYMIMVKKFRTAECYFQRAIEFKPNDAYVYLLHGILLYKNNDLKKSIEQLNKAEALKPDNAEIQYNIGLIYFKQNEIDLSVKHAKKAYSLGFPLPYLRDELEKLGKW